MQQITILIAFTFFFSDRVGGRTYSIKMKAADNKYDSFDLGGEWVGKWASKIWILNFWGLGC